MRAGSTDSSGWATLEWPALGRHRRRFPPCLPVDPPPPRPHPPRPLASPLPLFPEPIARLAVRSVRSITIRARDATLSRRRDRVTSAPTRRRAAVGKLAAKPGFAPPRSGRRPETPRPSPPSAPSPPSPPRGACIARSMQLRLGFCGARRLGARIAARGAHQGGGGAANSQEGQIRPPLAPRTRGVFVSIAIESGAGGSREGEGRGRTGESTRIRDAG